MVFQGIGQPATSVPPRWMVDAGAKGQPPAISPAGRRLRSG